MSTFNSLELKGFQRIQLGKGESKSVVFEITQSLLSFYNDELEFDCEVGAFSIMIGISFYF